MLEPLGRVVQAELAPAAGEHVLDVGCGCGSTTLALADAVGPAGTVTGIDVSGGMLDVARRAAAGRPNVRFVEGDAGTHPYRPDAYDVVYSRLGTMFFEEPEVAFTSLRRALRPGGRLGFVAWRSLHENPWATEPREVAGSIVPLLPVPDASQPGPFSLARAERITALLSQAGFVDVSVEPLDRELLIGEGDVDEAIEFYLRLLPTGYLMIEADRPLLDRVRVSLRAMLERYRHEDRIWMGSASWLVSAR